MKSKVYLDDDNIIHVDSIGEQDEREALEGKNKVLELAEKLQGKCKILNDLTNMGKSRPESRKIMIESLKHKKVGKVANFGANTVSRFIASVMIKASGTEDKVRMFKTKEEALKWLKE